MAEAARHSTEHRHSAEQVHGNRIPSGTFAAMSVS